MSQVVDILKTAPSLPPADSLPSNDSQFQGFGAKTTSIQLRLRLKGYSLMALEMHPSSLWKLILSLILRRSYDNFQIDMEKVRARVIIEGRVQGVLFRHYTQEIAFRLGIRGWVKNRRDGFVEAVFEGDKERVDQIIQWCHRGPSEARVTKVHLSLEDYRGEFEDFSVTF